MFKLIRTYTAILGLSALILACATVPKEVVELSYKMGEDISAVQTSYKDLIHKYFETLKKERLQYLENEWMPLFIKTWIEDGRIRDIVKGDIIWSEEKNDFSKPIHGKEEAGLLTSVKSWSLDAVEQIEAKKTELLSPLNQQEEQLIAMVDDAFNCLSRGNASITAHLNSLRKVQEVQDDMLAAMNIKDLRDKINNSLVTASDKATEGLNAIKKADGVVQEIKKKIPKKTNK